MSKAVYILQGNPNLYVDVYPDQEFSSLDLRYIDDMVTYLSSFPCTSVELLTYLTGHKIYFTIIPNEALVYIGDDKSCFCFDLEKNEPNETTLLFIKRFNLILNRYVDYSVRNY